MPKTINIFDAPSDFWDCWDWVKALDAFDFGDTGPLAALISEIDIPDEIKAAVAKIVAGERTPNLKAAAKLKIAPSKRLEAVAEVSRALAVYEAYKSGPHIEIPGNSGLSDDEWAQSRADFHTRKIEHFADEQGLEVADARSLLDHLSRKAIEDAAAKHGVSVRTMEEWLRDFRQKIRDFPDI